MATNRVNRGILRELTKRNLEWNPGQQVRITDTGQEMLFVAFVAERWLQSSPDGPLQFDSDEGEAAIAALVRGWCTTVIHALAPAPMTLRELELAVGDMNRPAVWRALEAMRHAGLVEARPGQGEGALYAVTDWLRGAIAPLTVAARLERRQPRDDMAPIDGLDVEAAFMLTLPLLELPTELHGSCRLGVEIPESGLPHLSGATARVEAGRVSSCAVQLEDHADAWAIASPDEWLDTVIEPGARSVGSGGDRLLARTLLDGLHATLFGIPVR